MYLVFWTLEDHGGINGGSEDNRRPLVAHAAHAVLESCMASSMEMCRKRHPMR